MTDLTSANWWTDGCASASPPLAAAVTHWSAWLGMAVLAACASPQQPAASRFAGEAATAGAPAPEVGGLIAQMPTCAADNPFCVPAVPVMTASSVPTQPGPTDCGALPIDLRPAGVNIMLAIDGSAAMLKHWPNIVTAIQSLRENNPTAAFGLHLFWADAVDLFSGMTNMNTSNNACRETHNKLLELGNHTAQELVGFLGSAPPGGTISEAYQVAPVIDSINYYLTHASTLADPKRTNYLVVMTAANDNCFGSAFVGRPDKLVAYQKLAVELSKRNIRTIPVGVDAPSMPAVPTNDPFMVGPGLTGTSSADMPITTDYEALAALLKDGASALSEVPRIDTPANLAKLISQVGQTFNNCRFEIPAALDANASVNPFQLSFSINAKVVPRDRHQLNGWDFVRGSTTQVEFFGQGCQALQSGQSLQANKSCEQNVCGTAAVSVETKPRMMLLLLDSSASRTECTDGSLDCLTPPGPPERPLTYWEVVQQAVEVALVAPVNDDVAFGMQFFPSKTSENFSCEVVSQPEVAPVPGGQIAVMKAMLEKLPFGLSPVVAVLESVAAAPGKLADPGVLGTVVMLTDGGDNCSGAPQQEIVSRLGAAAKKLFDAGVKTYAVRYGSANGETPEQAAQLNAVVTNGGTALTGTPVAYIDAKNANELASALAGISDRLAACSFTLTGIKADVDKNRTSLYLNGEQIGLDAKATKQGGWNWVDPARTTVELYGDACMAFKTNRQTRVVLEFGCEPIVIKGPD